MTRWKDELEFATSVAHQAGEVLRLSYGRVEHIGRKSRRDVVTEVDFASERVALDAIQQRYPDDAILAEESGHHRREGSHGNALRTWIVDPLDGTVNYANGIPFFCVSVGMVEDGQPAVGVVYDPLRQDS